MSQLHGMHEKISLLQADLTSNVSEILHIPTYMRNVLIWSYIKLRVAITKDSGVIVKKERPGMLNAKVMRC